MGSNPASPTLGLKNFCPSYILEKYGILGLTDFSTLHLRFATGEKMLSFNSRHNKSLLRPFFAMLSASSLALIGVIAIPAATETVSAETVINQLGVDIDGEAVNDQSGSSAALSSDGSRVAVGAPYNDGNGTDAGHVRIYDLHGGTWTQVGSDIDGEAESDTSGQTVALSSDGSRVAIGAPYNDGGGDYAGQVRLYDLVEGAWTKVGQDINGEAEYDFSGSSVALSSDGSRVAVGAPYNDGNGTNAGQVRIYDLDGGTWTQVGSDIDGEEANDFSGYSVALSSDGSRVAIGAPYDDGGGTDAGQVRLYDLVGGAWTKVGQDINGEAAGDLSGDSVALSSDGSRVAIGAYRNDDGGDNAGQVRIYDLDGGTWTQVGSDIDGEAADDEVGDSVALSGDGSRVAIVARYIDGNGNLAGQVRIYDYDGFSWTQVGSDIDGEASGLYAGMPVALSSDGSRVAIGAPGNAGNGSAAGHVRVFSISQSPTPDSGPLPTSRASAEAGSEATFTGLRLETVSSATVGDIDLPVISATSDSLVLSIPLSMASGTYDVVLNSSSGKKTVIQGLTVTQPSKLVAVDKKLTVGSFKGFIAIYTKGYEGSKLSAKVAGKWLVVDSLDESWRGNDYSRKVRFTGAGYDIFVHLYIDGEYIRTDELRTK